MKVCAENPAQGEYTLCGFAFDAPDTESDCEPFVIGRKGDHVTCSDCLRVIASVKNNFTRGGRVKE